MFKFYDPVYRINFHFVSSEPNKAQKKIFGELVDGGDSLGKFVYAGNDVLIYVGGFNRTPKKISILVHEINHAVDYIFEWLGIEDSEARSYYAEYLTLTILNAYKKTKKIK